MSYDFFPVVIQTTGGRKDDNMLGDWFWYRLLWLFIFLSYEVFEL